MLQDGTGEGTRRPACFKAGGQGFPDEDEDVQRRLASQAVRHPAPGRTQLPEGPACRGHSLPMLSSWVSGPWWLQGFCRRTTRRRGLLFKSCDSQKRGETHNEVLASIAVPRQGPGDL